MKQLFKHGHSFSYALALTLLLGLFSSCKITENTPYETDLLVRRVKKHKNGVYVIYAHRNDTIFKIVSYYDGEKHPGEKRLRWRNRFNAKLYSVFDEFNEKVNLLPYYGQCMEFRGVTIGVELDKNIFDVWFCRELNGPYLPSKHKMRTVKKEGTLNTAKKEQP